MGFIYLKIDGVEGGCVDSNHKKEIELLGWGWGASNPGKDSKTAKFQKIVLSKKIDRSSTKLFKACSDGEEKKEAKLTVDLDGKNNVTLTMSPVRISSINISTGQDEKGKPAIVENVTLDFNKMIYKYVAKDKSNHEFERQINT